MSGRNWRMEGALSSSAAQRLPPCYDLRGESAMSSVRPRAQITGGSSIVGRRKAEVLGNHSRTVVTQSLDDRPSTAYLV